MWVETLWIPAFAGMTEKTDGDDKLNPTLSIFLKLENFYQLKLIPNPLGINHSKASWSLI